MAVNPINIPTTQSSLVGNSQELELPNSEMNKSFYFDFINELEANKEVNGLKEVDFENLKNISDNNDVRNILWYMLTEMYDQNTISLEKSNKEIEKLKTELKFINEEKEDTSKGIKDYQDSLSTSKKKGLSYLSEVRKTEYQNNHLTVILIILIVILAFPLLKTVNILNKLVALILFSSGLVLIAGYAFYFLWYNIKDRDNLDFSKKSFSTIDGSVFETPENQRECVPLDENENEGYTEEETEETECINPNSLKIKPRKMQEYLDEK